MSVTLPEHPEMAEHIREHLIQVCAAPISPNHPLKFPVKSYGMHEMVDFKWSWPWLPPLKRYFYQGQDVPVVLHLHVSYNQ